MKKIISEKKLREKMSIAVNLLCDTVKSTLGPKGSNVIIDHSDFTPFITNDGVTISENVQSDDAIINTILELTKEASMKTNEIVGDGTTSTLVILQSLFNNGLKYLNEYDSLYVKDELLKSLKKVVSFIQKDAKKPTPEELKSIAITSSNDEEIGNIISDTYLKILNKDAINIEEGFKEETVVKYLKGYVIDSNLASPYFFQAKTNLKFSNVKILLVNNHLDNIEEIANIINFAFKSGEAVIILANSYNSYLVEDVINYNMDNNTNIILLNNPEYGYRKLDIYDDIRMISGAKIISNLNNIDESFLGTVANININQEKVVFNFKLNNDIKKAIIKLSDEEKESMDKEYLQKRIAMFQNGCATILVGGLTKLERREKKMRFDDALCAVNEAFKGISLGSGITFYKASDSLEYSLGDELLKTALREVAKVILNNASLDSKVILDHIKKAKYKVIYNVKSDQYEDSDNTRVIDPTSVLIEALSNATSIASLLLTTKSLIINEYPHNLPKAKAFDNEL